MNIDVYDPAEAERARNLSLPEEQAMAKAETMAKEAMEANFGFYCFFSTAPGEEKHKPFYMPYSHALIPGHIYSEAGFREARISQTCEFCFDKAFKEEDDE